MKKYIAVIIIMIILSMTLIGCDSTTLDSVVELNWGISIPLGYKEIYNANEGVSFHGDGIRYHILEYNDSSELENLFDWNVGKTKTIYSDNCTNAAIEFLNEINVSKDKRPDFSKCVCWYQSKEDNSELIIFYEMKSNILYIVESFL